MKKDQRVIFLSCEFEIIKVDKKRGKVWIRNSAQSLRQPDREVDAQRVRRDEQQPPKRMR